MRFVIFALQCRVVSKLVSVPITPATLQCDAGADSSVTAVSLTSGKDGKDSFAHTGAVAAACCAAGSCALVCCCDVSCSLLQPDITASTNKPVKAKVHFVFVIYISPL